MDWSFAYFPQRFMHAVDEIVGSRKVPKRNDAAPAEGPMGFYDKLESILKEIDRNKWEFKVNLLGKKDLRLLIDEIYKPLYPTAKLLEILDVRYNDKMFVPLLKHLYNSVDLDLTQQKAYLLKKLPGNAFLTSIEGQLSAFLKSDMIHYLVEVVGLNRDVNAFKNVARSFYLQEEDYLYQEVLKEMVLEGLKQIVDSMENLSEYISGFAFEEQLRFLANYLSDRHIDKMDSSVMNFFYHKYGEPEELKFFWSRCTQSVRDAFTKWLLKDLIETSLGNDERSSFWKTHIDQCTGFSVYLDKVDGNIVMYFNDFVVVEFTKVGNAAYFYDTKVFEETFARFQAKRYRVKPFLLKDKQKALITKSHIMGWQRNFNITMQKLYKGDRWRL